MRQPKQNNLHGQHPLQLNSKATEICRLRKCRRFYDYVLSFFFGLDQLGTIPAGRPTLRRAVNVDVNGC